MMYTMLQNHKLGTVEIIPTVSLKYHIYQRIIQFPK